VPISSLPTSAHCSSVREAVLHDGRHGHLPKLRPPVRQWLETPDLQATWCKPLCKNKFGILVSIGHLNLARAKLGIGSLLFTGKKTPAP